MQLNLTKKHVILKILTYSLVLFVIFYFGRACSYTARASTAAITDTIWASRLGKERFEFNKEEQGKYYTTDKALSFDYTQIENMIYLTFEDEETTFELAKVSKKQLYWPKRNIVFYLVEQQYD